MGVRGAVGQLLWLRGPEGGDEKEKQHSDTLLGVCWRGNLRRSFAVIHIAMLACLWPSPDQRAFQN